MLTRCPHCETAFRVSSEQLKVRQGKVRCGACGGVFSALDWLADEPQVVISPQPAPDVPPVPAPAIPEPEAAPTPAELPIEIEPEPETGSGQEVESVPEATPAQEAQPVLEAEPSPEPETVTESAQESEGEVETPLPEEWQAAEEMPSRRWPWALGVALLLCAGVVQLLYYFRVEVAVMAPELRPALTRACELADCSIPRPRKPELASIDASDLAPAGADRLLLTATLKNRAPFAQEYPHLELTLTDTRDAPLLRKVLPPADWLPPGRNPADGFAARDEVPVQLLLEAPGVPAIGYRLYLFYP